MRVRGMAEIYVRASPPRMLQRRSLVAALGAARETPQLVAGCFGAPSDHEWDQGHRRVVQALLAVDPGPAVATLKVPKGRTWPRRLSLGVRAAPTSQPPRHGSGIEMGGLAAHKGNVGRCS
jgi:hypothetical protein